MIQTPVTVVASNWYKLTVRGNNHQFETRSALGVPNFCNLRQLYNVDERERERDPLMTILCTLVINVRLIIEKEQTNLELCTALSLVCPRQIKSGRHNQASTLHLKNCA